MIYKIFFIAFALSLLLQGLRVWQIPMIDANLWSGEAIYVEENDKPSFYISTANAHPGGTMVEGTIAMHAVLGGSYRTSLKVFLALAESIVVGFICVLCYRLRKSHAWWLLAVVTLALNPLYDNATPLSALEAVLAVLFFLLTWILYEKQGGHRTRALVTWAVVAGITVSTRADTGTVLAVSLALFLLLSRTVSVGKMLWATLVALATFALTDPYLWLLGFEHIRYIVSTYLFNYTQMAPAYFPQVTAPQVILFSLPSFIAIGLGSVLFLSKKKTDPVPTALYTALLCMTSFLYIVLLTSGLQMPRYFMPQVFIWETLLPLYFFALLPSIRFGAEGLRAHRLRLLLRYGFIVLFAAYPLSIFGITLYFYAVA